MRPLIDETDKRLTTKVELFDFTNPSVDPVQYESDMIDLVKYYGAYGLSANQFGDDIRMIVFGAGDDYASLWNPVITKASEKLQYGKEGCVSFPYLIMNVYRPKEIEVEFALADGTPQTHTFTGLTARTICQGIDFLNGIPFTKAVPQSELQRGMGKRKTIRKRALRKERGLRKLYKEMDLTEEQVQQVETYRTQRTNPNPSKNSTGSTDITEQGDSLIISTDND